MPEIHSPTAEQLPKMPTELQSEVAQRAGLKHVTTLEKNVLPTKEDLVEERKHEDLKKGIHTFDAHKLRHVETENKSVMPSPEDIAIEKTPQLAAEFDQSGLKHVETNVKTGVEVIDKTEQ
uniref:Thymosin beta n=1 Tax=Globodera rostochiensis TaxID=31243 RepID=A0A914HXD2_GLORO